MFLEDENVRSLHTRFIVSTYGSCYLSTGRSNRCSTFHEDKYGYYISWCIFRFYNYPCECLLLCYPLLQTQPQSACNEKRVIWLVLSISLSPIKHYTNNETQCNQHRVLTMLIFINETIFQELYSIQTSISINQHLVPKTFAVIILNNNSATELHTIQTFISINRYRAFIHPIIPCTHHQLTNEILSSPTVPLPSFPIAIISTLPIRKISKAAK